MQLLASSLQVRIPKFHFVTLELACECGRKERTLTTLASDGVLDVEAMVAVKKQGTLVELTMSLHETFRK